MTPARRACLLLLCALATLPARAEDSLGRLFFSAAERAALDGARRAAGEASAVATDAPATPGPPGEAAPPAVAVPLPELEVTGVVARSRGPATAWINGVDSYGKRLEDLTGGTGSLRIGRGGVVIAGPDGAAHTVRPGQVFDPNGGTVTERYRRLDD